MNFENWIKMALLYIAYFVFGSTSQILSFTEFKLILYRGDAAAYSPTPQTAVLLKG
jgi:hypothetical protein